MAFWGIEIKPGKPYLHQYDDEKGRLRLSQATLGSGSSKEKAVVVCNVGDKKPIYLCSLLPRKLETVSLNIEFEEYEEVTFSVEGPHSIHLSGFFYGEKPDSDEDYSESDSDEDGVLEGAEMDSGDDSEFDFDDVDDLTDTDMDMVPNSGVRIEEIVDEEKPTENAVSEQSKKKNKRAVKNDESSQKQIVPKTSSDVAVLESEDEDGFPISSTADDKTSAPSGKPKSEASTGKGEKGQAKRKAEVEDSEKSAKRKKDDSATGDVTASEPANVEAPTPKSKKKNKKAKDKQEGGNNNTNGVQKEETKPEQTPDKAASVTKKDKKNKQQEKTPEAKPSQIRTFANGLITEEIQMGKPNGKRADSGKKISMRYIGKLKKNGNIFDSNIGKAPFKFRLGVGQVISGWDVGIKGMRVGDKRRLTIPPSMGYGARGAPPDIPPNAWLVFDVELIDVN